MGSRFQRIANMNTFILVFVAIGAAGILWGIVHGIRGIRTAAWPGVEGRVIASEVVTYRTRGGHRNVIEETLYAAKVVYEYPVAGRTRRCDAIKIGQVDTSDPKDAQRIVARYPIGKQVTVHYNPDQSDQAVLEAGVGPGVLIPLGGGLFLIVFPLAFRFAWKRLE